MLGLVALAASTGRTPAANPPAARAGGCYIRVIVAFSPAMARAPDDGFVKDVARAAGVELVFVSTIAPNLQVFTLSAADGDSGCHDVVESLRRDSRVRSVDIDTRRQHTIEMFLKRSATMKSVRVAAHFKLFITANVSKMQRDGIEEHH